MTRPLSFTRRQQRAIASLLAAGTLTEGQIEYRVECAVDRLDKEFNRGDLSQREYDHEISMLDKWAQQQYDHAKG